MENKDDKMFFAGVAAVPITIILGLLVMIPTLLLAGILLSFLWNWWISPTFGIRTLTIVEAMGIELVIRYFRTNYSDNKIKVTLKSFALGLLTDIFIVFIGWLLLNFK